MRILIVNQGLSDNYGDQAIAYCLERVLKEANHEVSVANFSGDSFGNYHEIANCNTNFRILKNIFKFILPKYLIWLFKNYFRIRNVLADKFDVAIIGGGQLVLSKSNFPIAMFMWTLLLKSKIILFAVGCGSHFSYLDSFLYRVSFRRADSIYVRDKHSQNMMKKEFGLNVGFVPDSAFLIHRLLTKKDSYSKLCLISIVDYKVYRLYNGKLNLEEYCSYWIDLIRQKCAQGYEVSLFYSTYEDFVFLNSFKKHVSDIKIVQVDSLNTFLTILSRAELVISGRMHPLIIAYALQKNIEVFSFSDKLRSFKKEYCMDNNISPLLSQSVYDTLFYSLYN
ncbi:polysaccharide pyruvyl transferase family protein [Bacteroides timonensis]|uniref:polysaccharide pyruvyl transferase family protein n=1 Tax=Bacteroides timonensis TaxID=1470345 RepID=UPI0004B1FEBB|nr:polysaccharide pyruvyl transferase family protein [Bacteroides timonensis]